LRAGKIQKDLKPERIRTLPSATPEHVSCFFEEKKRLRPVIVFELLTSCVKESGGIGTSCGCDMSDAVDERTGAADIR